MKFSRINPLHLIDTQRKRRIFLIIASLLVSTTFYVLKEQILDKSKIEISENLGQKGEGGNYNFGDYTGQVNNLIQKGNLISDGKVLNRYTPGYPYLLYTTYLLSGIFRIQIHHALFILAAIFIALSTLIIGELAFIIYKSSIAAIIAGLIYTTHPYILQGITKVMSETPFMTFLYLTLIIFVLTVTKRWNSYKYPVFIGILSGISMLIRPIALFIPLILAVLMFIFLRAEKLPIKLGFPVLIVIFSVLAILPWQVSNYQHNQKILLSSDDVNSILDGFSFNNHPRKEPLKLSAEADRLSSEISSSAVKTRGEFFRLTCQKFTEQPGTMSKLIILKASRSWYGVFGQQAGKEKIKLIILAIYGALTVFAVTKFDFSNKTGSVFFIITLVMMFYFWAMTIMVVSMVRYMYPVFGLMVVFFPALLVKSDTTYYG